MSRFRRQVLVRALQPLDFALMVLSLGVANAPVLLRVGLPSFAEFLSLKIKLQNFLVFIVLMWLWRSVFLLLGLYDSKRRSSRKAEAFDVTKATSFFTVILISFALTLHLRMVTPTFVALFWASSTFMVAGSRLLLRTWLRQIRSRGHNSRKILIVGSNPRAIEFASRIQHRPEWGYHVLGFADNGWAGARDVRTSGLDIVCDLTSLPAFLRRNVVDEVVIALPIRSFHEDASRIATLCETQGIILRLLSDIFDLKTARPLAEDFDGAALTTHYAGPGDGWPILIKRILDTVLSAALIVILTPLLVLTAILIKLISPGPVFFIQKRIGLNKRVFHIYKFRTMVVDAEKKLAQLETLNEVSGPVFKIKRDPRVTALGRFLRKTSIDELPQLFNVLKGDMSLVGPRPLQLRDYELFTQAGQDWQRCRFSVRPGITCLWQVNGRSSMPFEKWMELDLQYVRKWSLWLDLQILAKTIPAVLKGSGAA
jgi:exopolysaccharide biosynthesis polyprenyl glycosylphosphotransferase